MTDPIADLLTHIKNSYMAGKKQVTVSHSKMREAMVNLLSRHGYLGKVGIEKKDKIKKTIIAELVYRNKEPRITQVQKISTPGKKVYVGKSEIPRVLGGLGIAVISSPLGLLTDREARKKGVGGEFICKIW